MTTPNQWLQGLASAVPSFLPDVPGNRKTIKITCDGQTCPGNTLTKTCALQRLITSNKEEVFFRISCKVNNAEVATPARSVNINS